MKDLHPDNRYRPIGKPWLTLTYLGCEANGPVPNDFRLMAQITDISPLTEPFLAFSKNKVILRGPLSRKVDRFSVRMAIEPNSTAFALGESIHIAEANLWCAEYPASGTITTDPIRLRTTESLITASQEATVRFKFRWQLHVRMEEVLVATIEQAMEKSGLYGIRVLARRVHDAKHALHHPGPQQSEHAPEDQRYLRSALTHLYFAFIMRQGGPADLRSAFRAFYGSSCLDVAEGLIYGLEGWNALSYGYLGACAGFQEHEVMAVPDLGHAFVQLESIGLRDVTDRFLQDPGPGWLDYLSNAGHLRAELLRIGHRIEREGFAPRADLSVPNALGLGYDLGKSLNGRKRPPVAVLMGLLREAGLPAEPLTP